MTVAYRWDVETFLRAHDAGVFGQRVELVEGEVWPVVLGDWHGKVTVRVVAALLQHGDPRQSTLPSAGSLPDPDVWLLRPDAQPAGALSARLSSWSPDDVLLVVEVSDETVEQDLTVKARLYAEAGWQRYWVVTRDAVHEHTLPTATGYRSVRRLLAGEDVLLPDGTTVPVAVLIG